MRVNRPLCWTEFIVHWSRLSLKIAVSFLRTEILAHVVVALLPGLQDRMIYGLWSVRWLEQFRLTCMLLMNPFHWSYMRCAPLSRFNRCLYMHWMLVYRHYTKHFRYVTLPRKQERISKKRGSQEGISMETFVLYIGPRRGKQDVRETWRRKKIGLEGWEDGSEEKWTG
jgi:hypothetical protein